MAYCRWSEDCEVYVYASVYGGFTIAGEGHFNTRLELINELNRLKSLGKKIPKKYIIYKMKLIVVSPSLFGMRSFCNES